MLSEVEKFESFIAITTQDLKDRIDDLLLLAYICMYTHVSSGTGSIGIAPAVGRRGIAGIGPIRGQLKQSAVMLIQEPLLFTPWECSIHFGILDSVSEQWRTETTQRDVTPPEIHCQAEEEAQKGMRDICPFSTSLLRNSAGYMVLGPVGQLEGGVLTIAKSTHTLLRTLDHECFHG